MPWAAAAAVAGAVITSQGQKKAAQTAADSNQAQIEANKLDPRVTNMLYGPDGTSGQGLIDKYRGYLDQPQDPRLANYGNANLDYLGNANSDMGQLRQEASGLLSGSAVPKVQATGQAPLAYMYAHNVDSPSQNKIDLSKSYQDMIYGAPGANPYLTGAIQKGIDQSSNAFGNMVSDAKNATNDVLGNIRGGAVIAGGYGGSRQGIAEGKAIESMNTQLGRAASQFGQNNTDAAVAAQAGAYDTDRSRALAATQGLGAQQYGVASQDAAAQNAADLVNVNRTNDVNAEWARRDQAAQGQNQQATLQGAGMGAGLLSGALGTAYGVGQNQNNYGLNQAGKVNGLLQPYLSKNPVPTQLEPVYNNSAGAALGGAAAGLSLYNKFANVGKAPAAGGTQSWNDITNGWQNGTGY